MRDLSYSQARTCELALGKICRCRCGGLLHGALRGNEEDMNSVDFFNQLDEYDPHHIDSEEQKLRKKMEKQKIVDSVLAGERSYYSAFMLPKTPETRQAGIDIQNTNGNFLSKCVFCQSLLSMPLDKLVLKANYKNGWLHDCKLASRLTGEYSAYRSILVRCYDTHHPSYAQFGAMGIKADRWKDNLEQFLLDMGLKPDANAIIGRRDKSLGYEPDNTVWVVDGKIVKGIAPMALHTMYQFGEEWFKFWLVEYDYKRPSKVIRTEEYQAPVTLLAGDMSFSLIRECPSELVDKWLAKFGEKFHYTGARKVDNGNGDYTTLDPNASKPIEPATDTSVEGTTSTPV